MKTIIEIEKMENGAHRNQTIDFPKVPDGWIAVPEPLQADYDAAAPFFDTQIENGVLVGIKPREKPVAPEPKADVSKENITLDMLADHEYRLSLMELTETTNE